MGISSPRLRPAEVGLALALVALGVSTVEVIRTQHEHEIVRQDLAEVEDVSHGLLDPNVWIEQVAVIIETKINQFRLTSERRKELKPILERMLGAVLTKADQYLYKQRDATDFKDRLKEDLREQLMSDEDLRRGIPGYADSILDEMARPASRRELQQVLRGMLSQAAEKTFSSESNQRLSIIHRTYGCDDRSSCAAILRARLSEIRARSLRWAGSVLTFAFLLFAGVGWITRRAAQQRDLVLLIVGCGLLMACGVFTPMLDVEARISKLSFMLLGEPMEFRDQVLYFQSKSVLDVVRVLAATGKPDMIMVGLLLVTFSVAFPLAKLTASFLYVYDVAGLRRIAVVRFFALKSSKWSMADVFVVAMFMAYIGFNGVVDSELRAFAKAGAPDVSILTTNGSSLQLGYFLFLAFCIAGLVTSSILSSAIVEKEEHEHAPAGLHLRPAPSLR